MSEPTPAQRAEQVATQIMSAISNRLPYTITPDEYGDVYATLLTALTAHAQEAEARVWEEIIRRFDEVRPSSAFAGAELLAEFRRRSQGGGG